MQADQSICYWLENFMSVKLLTEHHLKFLSLNSGEEMPDRDPLTYISWEENQVFVTINSNLLLDRAQFYQFYSGLRK